MGLKNLIYGMCGYCDWFRESIRKDGSKFYYCSEYEKPITKKILKMCWEENRKEYLHCLDCGIFIHIDDYTDYGKCPECGSTNLRKAKSFEEEWG